MCRKVWICLICAALFSGMCAGAETLLPDPSPAPQQMLLGETEVEYLYNATLYYVSSDGLSLTPVYRTLAIGQGASAIEAVLDQWMDASGAASLSAVPGDARVLACEVSNGLVTVNLSLDARNVQSEQELFALCMCITSTLTQIQGVTAVNVLINGRQIGFGELPLGALTAEQETLATAWAQLRSEYERFGADSGTSGSIFRQVYLYLPSDQGGRFLPELVQVEFSDADFASTLFYAFQSACKSAGILPTQSADWLLSPPSVAVTDAGERILTLDFSGSLMDALERIQLPRWRFLGAATLTMCSFLPSLDGVCVRVNGEALPTLAVDEFSMPLTDGLLRRSDFSSYIGARVTVYLTDCDSGLLRRAEIAMPSRSARSAGAVLNMLLSDPSGEGNTFPEGISSVDALGISVSGSVATVNLSANFYRACQNLTEDEERNVVYAIVNTLCALESVRGVQILFEGKAVETLSRAVYLGTVLMPNPGLVA